MVSHFPAWRFLLVAGDLQVSTLLPVWVPGFCPLLCVMGFPGPRRAGSTSMNISSISCTLCLWVSRALIDTFCTIHLEPFIQTKVDTYLHTCISKYLHGTSICSYSTFIAYILHTLHLHLHNAYGRTVQGFLSLDLWTQAVHWCTVHGMDLWHQNSFKFLHRKSASCTTCIASLKHRMLFCPPWW